MFRNLKNRMIPTEAAIGGFAWLSTKQWNCSPLFPRLSQHSYSKRAIKDEQACVSDVRPVTMT
jgi:hypothetical protein